LRHQSAETEALENRVDQLESALYESEAKLSAVFRTTPDGLLISRLGDGSILDVNDSFLETMGFGREEVEGKTTGELGCWNSLADQEQFILSLKEAGEHTELCTTFRSRDGRTIPMRISGRVVAIDGEARIVSVLRDISDRVQTETGATYPNSTKDITVASQQTDIASLTTRVASLESDNTTLKSTVEAQQTAITELTGRLQGVTRSTDERPSPSRG